MRLRSTDSEDESESDESARSSDTLSTASYRDRSLSTAAENARTGKVSTAAENTRTGTLSTAAENARTGTLNTAAENARTGTLNTAAENARTGKLSTAGVESRKTTASRSRSPRGPSHDYDSDTIPDDIHLRNERSIHRSTVNAYHDGLDEDDASVPESVRKVISSSGRSLDTSVQRTMESRMGEDFSDVQVHTGPRAAKAAEDINAKAFTVGNHVAFNRGEYDPSSAEGQHVIAHELAHVRQQTDGAVSMLPQDDVEFEIDPDPELEREAEETAQRVMQGSELGIQRMAETAIHVQRMQDNSDETNRSPKSARDRPDIKVKYKQQPDIEVVFPERQLQSKFKHADDFGVHENWNKESASRFQQALEDHIHDTDTIVIEGTYHGDDVVHMYNLKTMNNVFCYPDGEFRSCWNLSARQEKYLLTTGEL